MHIKTFLTLNENGALVHVSAPFKNVLCVRCAFRSTGVTRSTEILFVTLWAFVVLDLGPVPFLELLAGFCDLRFVFAGPFAQAHHYIQQAFAQRRELILHARRDLGV